ncbi:MAG: RNA polymerase sigma factor RpoD/SigA [Candidatus Omnitrophota bacterium]|nr:RNA polymerase sigma factor RpoD/SigA [Candidatus Omnitrophota bacterium]
MTKRESKKNGTRKVGRPSVAKKAKANVPARRRRLPRLVRKPTVPAITQEGTPQARPKERRGRGDDPRRRKEKEEILRHEAMLEAPEERRRRKREAEDGTVDGTRAGEAEYTLDRTAMKIYLDQIEDIPLLSAAEEVSLAQKIQSHTRGSAQARENMIRCNLRLVISIAKRYSNMGLAFSDLVEEGNIGLMRAVEKFNPERGYRFSTYGSWWIKQAIMRALSNQGKTIRIPVYMYDIISKWRRVRDGLTQKLNRVPTRKEIANIMEVPVHKIKEIENIAGRPSSLNAPISLDGTAELIDLIEDDSSHSPDAQIGEMLRNERIRKLLDGLDAREKRILALRFGLADGQGHTLEEVAQEFGVTRERVRQIESAALKKIRVQMIQEKDGFENYLS